MAELKKITSVLPRLFTNYVRPTSGHKLGMVKRYLSSSDNTGTEQNGQDRDLETGLTETVLKLEEIDRDLYRCMNQWKPIFGGRSTFGGQIIGQGLVAASKTKAADAYVHSLHCYFLKPGDPKRPIIYQVERVRDGRSFLTRSVKAKQNGENILTMQVSFMRLEESLLNYQFVMPEVPAPDDVMSLEQILRAILERDLPEPERQYITKRLADEIPVEIRPVEPLVYTRQAGKGQEPKIHLWIRAKGHIGHDQDIHRCVAAYISDMSLLWTALIPYPTLRPKMMASLDHAMWFHTEFHTDDWMLYECESPRSIGGRGLCLGRLWRQDGTLAVSAAQEGVIRGELITKKV